MDQTKFVKSLVPTLALFDDAQQYGKQLAASLKSGEVKRIVTISCGAGEDLFEASKTFFQTYAPVQFEVMSSGTFMTGETALVDKQTEAWVMSKSGGAPETNEAADKAQGLAHQTVVFTKGSGDFSKKGDRQFIVASPDTTPDDPYLAINMITHIILATILAENHAWPHLEKLLAAFKELPQFYARVANEKDALAKQFAEKCKGQEPRILASGVQFTTARVIGQWNFMEKLEKEGPVINGDKFYHGYVEPQKPRPTIVIRSIDGTQALTDDACAYLKKNNIAFLEVNIVSFLAGFDEAIAWVVQQFLARAFLKRVVDHVAELEGQSLLTRNFMGKGEKYWGVGKGNSFLPLGN